MTPLKIIADRLDAFTPKRNAAAADIVAALAAAGYQVVPIEPTNEMLAAAEACEQIKIIDGVLSHHQIRIGSKLPLKDGAACALADAYRAMLAANENGS